MQDQQTSKEQQAQRSEHKPSAAPSPPTSGPLAQFEAWLYEVLVYKFPYQLPSAAKEWIVRYGPWVTLVLGIILALSVIPALMALMAVASYSTMYSGMYGVAVAAVAGPMFYVSLAVLAVQLVIMFISIPMLLKRQRKGWQLVFYANVVSLVYSLVSALNYGYLNFGTLLSGLVGAAIGLYFLFQIRSYYTN